MCFGGEKGTKTSMYLEAPAHSGCIVGKPKLMLPRTSYLEGFSRLSIYKTLTNSPSGAFLVVTGKYYLPNARNETLRPCRVRRVFFAKLLNHHPLLRADAKRAEDRERDQVRRTRYPIRDYERLADGIQR